MYGRLEELESEIRELEALASMASGAGSFGPAATALAAASRLRRDLVNLRAQIAAAATDDALERLQLLGQAATADGSWVAAGKLLREELELRAKREAAARAAAEAKAEGLSDDELLAELETALRALPRHVRAELLARVDQDP